MAGDKVDLDFIVNFVTNGQPKTVAEITKIQDGLRQLNKEGQVPEKTFKALDAALNKMSKSFVAGQIALKGYTKDFKALVQALQEAQKLFAKESQANAVAGSLKPTQDAKSIISLNDAKKNVATDEAQKASVVKSSREIIAANEREEAATRKLTQAIKEKQSAVKGAQTDRAYQKELAALTPLQAATKKLADAKRELYNANRQVSRAQSSGDLQRQSDALSRQEKAVRSVTSAENNFRKAQRASDSTTRDRVSNLPRLRYALYDISNAAGIFGAAVLAADTLVVKTAIDFEREFANVQRTSGVTGDAAEKLKQSFIDLSTAIPVSFSKLTEIGTLGAQLNIPTFRLAEFSDAVAKFSATTDVSVDQAATAFGRLDALLPDVNGNYEKLSDAILNVGVNSVATESQIIGITTQIAGVANVAGLSSDEVIGFAGALASLGLPAERSRGLVTRLFTNISSAVATGGPLLEKFAKVTRQSAEEFSNSWKNTPATQLIKILQGIGDTGPRAIETIQNLGLASVRDIPALLTASQNVDIFAESFHNAFDSAGTTATQFRVIAETVSSKLEVFSNNFQALANAVGSATSGPLGSLLDLGSGILKMFTKIASNPVGQFFALLTIGITVFGGILAVTTAGVLRTAAAMIAMKQAAIDTGVGMGIATAGINTFKVALISTGIGAVVLILGTLVAGLVQLTGAFDSAGDKAESYFGSLDELTNAMKKDLQEGARAGEEFSKVNLSQPLVKSTREFDEWQDTVRDSGAAIGAAKKAIDDTSDSVNTNTLSLRNNTKEWIANQIITDEKLRDAVTSAKKNLGDFGFDTMEYLRALGSNAGDAYMQGIKSEIDKSKILTNPAAARAGVSSNVYSSYQRLTESTTAYGDAVQTAADKLKWSNDVMEIVGTNTDLLSGSIADLSDQYKDMVSDIFENVNATKDQNDALESMGQAFRDSGADAAFSGQGVQDYIASILNSSATSEQAADRLQMLVNSIIASGYAAGSTAPSLYYLQQVIAGLGGSTTKGTINLSAFTSGLTKVGGGAGGASKQVRTLLDYASDLEKVWSRAFDIRFGSQNALDAVTSSWQDLNDEIADYMQKVTELTADKNIKEYFLSVANAYGDTLRAGVLNADLLDINNQLADAQAGASKELTGNSKAAIKNRKRVQDLINNYQDYIKALAESGASQADLNAAVNQSKADFIAQATALGYSTAELQPYIKSFDDMTVAIAKVPRNITVKADTNPALQAFNELMAKMKSSAGGGVSIPVSVADPSSIALPFARTFKQILQNSLGGVFQILVNGKPIPGGGTTTLKFFREGGFTGPGGRNTPAGIVHRGEYVIPKHLVNQATGLPYADALGRLQAGTIARNSYAGGGYVKTPGAINVAIPSTLEVQLSPTDRRLLQSIGGSGEVYMDGKIVTDVINNQNTNSSRRRA